MQKATSETEPTSTSISASSLLDKIIDQASSTFYHSFSNNTFNLRFIYTSSDYFSTVMVYHNPEDFPLTKPPNRYADGCKGVTMFYNKQHDSRLINILLCADMSAAMDKSKIYVTLQENGTHHHVKLCE